MIAAGVFDESLGDQNLPPSMGQIYMQIVNRNIRTDVVETRIVDSRPCNENEFHSPNSKAK